MEPKSVYAVITCKDNGKYCTLKLTGESVIDRVCRELNGLAAARCLDFEDICKRIYKLPTQIPTSRISDVTLDPVKAEVLYDNEVELGEDDRILYIDSSDKDILVTVCKDDGNNVAQEVASKKFVSGQLFYPSESFQYLDK